MEYRFRDIEKKWQSHWEDSHIYKVSNESAKPKCYVLDMFPYPSGAGLHVGHPLGYIASDIYSRYKRMKGFNVLHPMGFDSFGLPAEQYALDTGQHPAITTKKNIDTFKSQLKNIGFSYDWSREVRTSDPAFYKWTQWIFLRLFNSFYNRVSNKAESIDGLIAAFEKEGNRHHPFPDAGFQPAGSGNRFSAGDWNGFDEKTRQEILMQHRLAYCGYGEVNWCEALGTVLANDEVVNGVSERGGYPVEKKRLRQWYLRITEYAERLLEGLENVEFSDAMKEMQTNWIGKSEGAEIVFGLTPNPSPGGEGDASPQPSPGGEGESPRFFQTADKKSWGMLKAFGRSNRKNSTEAENILWQRLRNNKMGVKVRRQHTVGGYIADFAMLEVRLVIEVDGEYHDDEEQKLYDTARTGFFSEFDLDLIRFTNDQVINHTEDVINEIGKAIEDQKKKIKEKNILKDNSGEKKESSHKDPSPPGEGKGEAFLKVYTTRPDTIYGVDFMVIAPEHELVNVITTDSQRIPVEEYIAYVKSRSERERIAEKKITGVFTGAYAVNPFDGREIPVWISEYVLAGYGTGAIMGVPCGDERDHKFAKHFNIPITNIIGSYYNGEEANPTMEAILENSGFLNGMVMKGAIDIVIKALEERGIGVRKINYKMRDAAFSRQRYWGEPFPIVWKNGIAYPLDENELPLELPHVDSYSPGPDGEGPLSNIPSWVARELETNTMPGYAGSSWYFLRYMDPHNEQAFCDRTISDYWNQVDLYIGGTEHAVGHLLYSRMWTKFLFDTGLIGHDEPYKKLVNQGMIQGSSRFVYRVHGTNQFVSAGLREQYNIDTLHVDVNMVDGFELDTAAFRKWKPEYANAEFILENGELDSPLSSRRVAGGDVPSPPGEGKGEAKYICGAEVEKMSKSKFNTVNPDDLVDKYGADTFRMYEMFLGPVEMSKPWDTKGIEGVHRFLKKFWRMFSNEITGLIITDEAASPQELKVLHNAIKKIESDTGRFSFNTAVSAFMIATNELTDLKCHKRAVLEPLLVLLAPYAPHISEELWSLLGNKYSILDAEYPKLEEKYIKETSKEYPVAINGKTRTQLMLPLDISQHDVEVIVLNDLVVRKWLEDKKPKKIIYVKNKMINVVV